MSHLLGSPKLVDRKERVLSLRLNHRKSIPDTMAELGLTEQTYYKWRSKDPEFRRRANYVTERQREHGPREVTFRPFDAEFREKYFDHGTPWHMQQGIDLIESMKPGEKVMWLMPPAHAKTAIGEDYLCWLIAHFPDIRTLVISNAQPHAEKVLALIKRRMTDRGIAARYQDDYGPFKSENADKGWSKERILVEKATSGERDWTLEATGIQGQILGSRKDFILLDDIGNPDRQSDLDIERQLHWLRLVVFTRTRNPGGKPGKILCIANRISETDIYSRLIEEGFFDRVLILPAYDAECSDGRPHPYLWPEAFSVDEYEEIRKAVGPRVWEMNYQQEDTFSEGQKFPLQALEACFDYRYAPGDVPPGYQLVEGGDPAASKFSAFVVLAVHPETEHRVLVDFGNEKGLVGDGGDVQMGLIQFFTEPCRRFATTGNGVTRSLIRRLDLEAQSAFTLLSTSATFKKELTRLGVPLHVHKTGRGENDLTDMALEQLAAPFINRTISIPAADGGKAHFRPFIEQLARWRPGDKKIAKDMLKAFQFAMLGSEQLIRREKAPKTKSNLRLPPYLERQRRSVPLR